MVNFLYVDDNRYLTPGNAKFLFRVTFANIQLDEARTNEEALEKAREQEYDIIFYKAYMDTWEDRSFMTARALQCFSPVVALTWGETHPTIDKKVFIDQIDPVTFIRRYDRLDAIARRAGLVLQRKAA